MPTITYRLEGNVAMIGLNRPERLNAITPQLRSDLRDALDEFAADDSRVAILYGEGRAFCTGMDLTEGHVEPRNAAEDRDYIHGWASDWLHLFDHPKPIIAQVHGFCIAGGVQLPPVCDIVTIAADTVVGWPRVPMGAGWISPMVAHSIGVQRAKLMSYRVGSVITGEQAAEWGYAALAFPPERLAEETMAIAQDIAKLPSDMLRLKKLANNRVLERQGFREAVLAVEWDALSHETDTVQRAIDWVREFGIKEAIAKFAREGM